MASESRCNDPNIESFLELSKGSASGIAGAPNGTIPLVGGTRSVLAFEVGHIPKGANIVGVGQDLLAMLVTVAVVVDVDHGALGDCGAGREAVQRGVVQGLQRLAKTGVGQGREGWEGLSRLALSY